MRKTTEILRLKHEVGLTHRQIARSCGLSHPTVSKYLERAQQAGLGWPLPENVDEEHLQALLFPAAEDGSRPSRPLPDMEYIHKELRRAHVTRHLLWEEYRADHADGYSYTQFCEHYRRWKAPLEVTLRQRHIAGEKTFLDWAGKTLSWTDKATGEIHPAYLFVAVLGASNYTFAETFADQQLPAWLDAHIHAVEFFGGVTKFWIPDNAKTGVHKPCYYEPQINDSYQDLADHYGTAILPTRTYAARDKAKVEHAVLNAERRIMARRRNLTFFSLGELNDAVRRCLTELNARPLPENVRISHRAFQRARPARVAVLTRPPLRAGRVETGQGQHRLPQGAAVVHLGNAAAKGSILLHLREFVGEEQHLAIAGAGHQGILGIVRVLDHEAGVAHVALAPHALQVGLPALAVGRIGEHEVELARREGVVGQGRVLPGRPRCYRPPRPRP